jgi:fibronectin-binding autotransporter adhesin
MITSRAQRLVTFIFALSVVALSTHLGLATDGTWITTASGTFNWNDASNWLSSTVPSGVGSTATIGTANFANPNGTIINLDVAPTVGNLTFNSRASGPSAWTMSGANTLTLNNTGGASASTITLNTPIPAQTVTLSAPLSAAAGFTLAGTGTLLVTSPYAAGFTGPTIINGNLNNTAVLTYAVANPNVQGLQIGTLTTTGSDTTLVNTASQTTGTINVNADVTATSFVVQTNSGAGGTANAPVVSSLINIAAGKTLTINDTRNNGTSAFTIGYDTGAGNSSIAPQTDVVFAGNALNVQAPGQIFTVGPNNATTTAANSAISILDLNRLSSFTFNGGSAGEVRIGGGNVTGTGNRTQGILTLANTSNAITAGTLTVGGGSNGAAANGSLLNLGTGTNVINADTVNVGTFKSTGTISFATLNTTGTLTMRGHDGTSPINLTIGYTTVGTAGTGTVNLTGHPVDLLINTLNLGIKAFNTNTTTAITGNNSGAFSFSAGTVSANQVIMASRTNAVPSQTSIGGTAGGSLTVNGGTMTVGSGGFTIANNTLANDAVATPSSTLVNGSVTVAGGTLQTNSDILVDPGTKANTPNVTPDVYTAAITVSGGTLDMLDSVAPNTRHKIGSMALPITSLTVTAGTIKDIGQIYNTTSTASGGNTNANGIIKTGAGTLVLAGTNSYTGDTQIGALGASPPSTATNGGVVVVTGTTNQGTITVNQGALSGTGTVGAVTLNFLDTTTPSNPSLLTSSVIDPGGSSAGGVIGLDGQYGTLTVKSLTVSAASATVPGGGIMRFDFNNPGPGPANDSIIATDSVSFAGPTKISLANVPENNNGNAGTVYTLVTLQSGTISDISNVQVLAPSNIRPGLSFTPQLDGTSTQLQLKVAGSAANLTWTGAAPGDGTTWDAGNASSNLSNWSNSGGATSNDFFYNIDSVTFGNGPANRTINIASQVQPKSVNVNNNVGSDYTFSGAGGITGSGTKLTKAGTGTLVISTLNSYTGPTTISAGKVIVTKLGGLVSTTAANVGTSAITIAAGSTLQVGNNDAPLSTSATLPYYLGGGLGSSVSSTITAPPVTNSGTILLNTTAGVPSGGSGPVIIYNVISGNGSIQMNNTGTVRLNGNNASFTGTISINAGTFQPGSTTAMGPSTNLNPINVANGATLDFQGMPAAVLGTRQFSIAGNGATNVGAIFNGGTQQQNAIQNLALTADASLTAGGRLEVKNGTLDLAGHTLTNLGGQFAITGTTVTGGGNITINNGARLTIESAFLQGAGTLTVTGGYPVALGGNAANVMNIIGISPGAVTRPITTLGNEVLLPNVDGTNISTPLVATNVPSTFDSNITLGGNLVIETALTSGTLQFTLNGNIGEDSTPRQLVLMPDSSNTLTTILGGANTFTGGVFIGAAAAANTAGGTILQLASSGALNASGANAVTFGNAVTTGGNYGLRLNGFNATISRLDATSAVAFVENGSFNPSTLTVNNSLSSSFAGVLQNGSGGSTLSLTKTGAGTLTLTGTSTYTGATVINSGTLAVAAPSGSIANSSVTVNAGGTLAGNGIVGGVTLMSSTATISPGLSIGTLTASSLTVNAGQFKMEIGSGNDMVNVTGTANFVSGGASTIVPIFTSVPSAGTFTLVSAGTLNTSGHVFSVSLPANTRFTGPNAPTIGTAGSLTLTLPISAATLTWTGSGDATTWDVGSSGTVNWSGGEKFFNLDGVTFDDSSSAHSVTLTAALQPSTATVNTAGTYTFSGSGSIAGTTGLTKTGLGTLVLGNASNSYSGTTDIQGGTLRIGNAAAISANSAFNIGSAGTLDLGGIGGTISALSGSTGGIINNSSATPATLTFAGDNSSYAGAIQNGASSVGLTVAGGTLTLSGTSATNTYSGPTTIQNGAILKAGANGSVGLSQSSPIVLGQGTTGGTLDLNGVSPTIPGLTQSGTGNAIVGNSTSTNSTLTVAATGTDTFTGIIRDDVAGGAGTGRVALTVSTGNLVLTGNNAYSGVTTISSGATLQAGNGGTTGSLGYTTSIVNNSGTLIFNRSNSVSLGVIVSGTGGALTKSGAGTLNLNAANTYTGTTTINQGTLALNVATAVAGGSSGSPLVLNGGTLAMGAFNESFNTLQLSNNSMIDMGGHNNDQLTFNDSSAVSWTSGKFLRVNNWDGNPTNPTLGSGLDRILVGSFASTGLTPAQLAQVHFTDYPTGAQLVSFGVDPLSPPTNHELVPASATRLLVGDVNQDTRVDVADVSALMGGLSDLSLYASQHPSLDAPTILDILDVNHDLQDTNTDLQGLIVLLANGGGTPAPGGGSLTAVPEPASFVLLGIGGAIAMATAYRRSRRIAT